MNFCNRSCRLKNKECFTELACLLSSLHFWQACSKLGQAQWRLGSNTSFNQKKSTRKRCRGCCRAEWTSKSLKEECNWAAITMSSQEEKISQRKQRAYGWHRLYSSMKRFNLREWGKEQNNDARWALCEWRTKWNRHCFPQGNCDINDVKIQTGLEAQSKTSTASCVSTVTRMDPETQTKEFVYLLNVRPSKYKAQEKDFLVWTKKLDCSY